MDEFIDNLISKGERANPGSPNDYEKDGILYCGSCHTPKQKKLLGEDFGALNGKIVPVMCKCSVEKKARAEAQQRRAENEVNRKLCFSGPLAEGYRVTMLQGKALNVAETYLNHWEEMKADGSGLLLWGGVGTGKTFLAAAIANGVIDKGQHARMITTSEIIIEATDRPEKMAFINELCGKQLLVIDDLGAERDTSFGQEVIETLVNKRYESGLPMIVTTNVPLKEMQNATDTNKKRIYDRILDRCVPVQLTGDSKRREFAADRTKRLRELLTETLSDERGKS